MKSSSYRLIPGSFVIVDKEPDGDSVRFVANDLESFSELYRARLLKPARSDQSVQLRFESIDAPELHYGSATQPFAKPSRDFLLQDLLGFRDIQFSGTGSKVTSATPESVPGFILSQALDPHGRPISFAFEGEPPFADEWIHPTKALLERSFNFQLLKRGLVYLLAYDSLPREVYKFFRVVALQAKEHNLGVWPLDHSAGFRLDSQDSLAPDGTLIFPKLFRRCTDFLKSIRGAEFFSLPDWIRNNPKEDDLVILGNLAEVHLSELVQQENREISFRADLFDIIFVEK
jgi:endonuclease YncB( thermonuclease family)